MKICINKQNKENMHPTSNACEKIKSNIALFKGNKQLNRWKDINDSIALRLRQNANENLPLTLTDGVASDEFDKLLEITSKCVDYYNKFVEQKNTHMQILEKAFSDIQANLNEAFKEIIEEATAKNQELILFLQRKHKQLASEKIKQQEDLKYQLDEIKSIHLTNLLKDSKSESYEFSIELTNFAGTLNKFYNIMSEIEKNNYEQNVDQCVSFINNLISQEIKNIVEEKIPHKFQEMMNFSFNNQKLFTFESIEKKHSHGIDTAQQILLENSFAEPFKGNSSKIAQELAEIEKNQKIRKQRMQSYMKKIDPYDCQGSQMAFQV